MTPRSLFLIPILALVGCGGVRHVATVSVVSSHAVLMATQATSDAAVCGKPTAAPAPACLTTEQRKAVAAKLSPAFGLDESLATAVRDWPAGTPQPAAIADYLAKISALVTDVVNALPDGALKSKLLTVIGGGQ
jgi:hypothetical protein